MLLDYEKIKFHGDMIMILIKRFDRKLFEHFVKSFY